MAAKKCVVKFKKTTEYSDEVDDDITVIRALCNKAVIGLMELRESKRLTEVNYIQVAEAYQRRGLGTALYEKAAEHACSEGRAFQSDLTRSPMAHSFWMKQYEKGRADFFRQEPQKGSKWGRWKAIKAKPTGNKAYMKKIADTSFFRLKKSACKAIDLSGLLKGA